MTAITQLQSSVLLTIDEARYEFVASAARLLREWRGEADALRQALSGDGPNGDRIAHDLFPLRDHQRVIDAIRCSGHAWVIDEQVEGIVSAVGLDDDRLGDVSVLGRVLSVVLEDR